MSDEISLIKLETIVSGASAIARQWKDHSSKLVIDEKSAGQFATNVDLEIEAFVRQKLTEQFPDQPIVGEELGGDLSPNQSGWAIDPIDGTSNFILGLPIWGISIGYIEAGQSRLGAISLPDLDVTLSAAKTSGLRMNGAPVEVSHRRTGVKIIAVGENDYETGAETDLIAQDYRDAGYSVVRYRCAVFSLAMAALGRLDGYVENGCGLWDIAAADVICMEAGLDVRTSRISAGRYAVNAKWPY
ncbi:MAG: inositol monophosphatase family protein [Pseudomonadota bacterium]